MFSLHMNPPHSPQIIQLVEVPAPPKLSLLPLPCSTHSSCCWSSSSESISSSSITDDDDDDDSEDEEDCESYCSSNDSQVIEDREPSDGSQSVKMSRVLAWRNSFDSVYATDDDVFQKVKRKYGNYTRDEDVPCDTSSQASQRRRISLSSSLHICPACDTSFPTMQQLQHHADQEACRIAVQYGFES